MLKSSIAGDLELVCRTQRNGKETVLSPKCAIANLYMYPSSSLPTQDNYFLKDGVNSSSFLL